MRALRAGEAKVSGKGSRGAPFSGLPPLPRKSRGASTSPEPKLAAEPLPPARVRYDAQGAGHPAGWIAQEQRDG
jgi:hypothetical protein